MIIILEYTYSIKRYIDTIETINKTLDILCPCCDKVTRKQGKYRRTVNYKTESYEIPVFRRRCAECKKTFSLLPMFIVPWGRFANHIIELFLRWILSGVPIAHLPALVTSPHVSIVSLKTLYRWKYKYLKPLLQWWQKAREQLGRDEPFGDGVLSLYREGIGTFREFGILVSLAFGSETPMPRQGNLYTAMYVRQLL